jgi:hypothetical protein
VSANSWRGCWIDCWFGIFRGSVCREPFVEGFFIVNGSIRAVDNTYITISQKHG